MSEKEILKKIDDIWNYCEEIDNHLPKEEQTGYRMLPDIFYIQEEVRNLQQKVEQLEKDKSYANWYAVKKEKEVEQLENIIKCIKEYADWHVGCCTDDINDYIDDDPKENKYIIDDLKEQREHWRDISKMCDGNFQSYMTNFIFAKE